MNKIKLLIIGTAFTMAALVMPSAFADTAPNFNSEGGSYGQVYVGEALAAHIGTDNDVVGVAADVGSDGTAPCMAACSSGELRYQSDGYGTVLTASTGYFNHGDRLTHVGSGPVG